MTAIAALALAACSSSAHASLGGLTPDPIFAPQSAGAKMLLDEEFDAPKLDTSVWFTCYSWVDPGQRCTNGGNLELEWYEARNVTLAGGIANLTAELHPGTNSHPFTSGMIQTGGTASTKATFAYRYGYAEIRAKLPKGAGMWPAFWLVQANRQWPPEIDIMEWQGVQPKTDVVTVKQAIYSILQSEINKEMLARGNDEYAFKILDPAVAPERPSTPPAWFLMLGGLVGSLGLSVMIAFVYVCWIKV